MIEPDSARLCALSLKDEPTCTAAAVVAVEDQRGEVIWPWKQHAGTALNAIADARVEHVDD